MNALLLYCRAGFENDCAAEIQQRCNQRGVVGYVQARPDTGYVLFHCVDPHESLAVARSLPFRELVFARQLIAVCAELNDLPEQDRIGPILEALAGQPLAGELRVEVADTNEAKTLSAFCRKFSVPLRQALRKAGKLSHSDRPDKPVLHLFMQDGQNAMVGYSFPGNHSPFVMGIPRLKFPKDAPSRSTLKLEEALHVFVPAAEWDRRLGSGLRAVDLGACPGGWTYQLVKRGMFVVAVDNGPMAPALMDSGQVTHYQEDGFKFEPRKKNVTWLVCDMVEKPARVARLMADWLVRDWCCEAIFNLKLPMKQRFDQVEQCLHIFREQLVQCGRPYELSAKQLYHDREEITVHARWR